MLSENLHATRPSAMSEYRSSLLKLLDERGWSHVLPDPDEPLLHLYAEGETTEVSEELEREVRELVEEILQGETATPRTSVEASS